MDENTETIEVELPDELFMALSKAASELGLGADELATKLVTDYVNREVAKLPKYGE